MGAADHQLTCRGAGRSGEAVAGGQGRCPGSGLGKGTRSTDRIADGDRIAPVHYQRAVDHHGTASEIAGRPAAPHLERSTGDLRNTRVGIIPRQDRRPVAEQGQTKRPVHAIGQIIGEGVIGSRCVQTEGAASRNAGTRRSGECGQEILDPIVSEIGHTKGRCRSARHR